MQAAQATGTNKAVLYQFVAQMRRRYGVTLRQYPIEPIQLAKTHAKVQVHPFEAYGLCGVAFAGEEQDSIILSSYRSIPERQFDCAHEMIHLNKHRQLNAGKFQCYGNVREAQNPFLEWEANAGAAEFIVPYRIFLPTVRKYAEDLQQEMSYRKLRQYLAAEFKTTVPIISLRFEDLRYELQQFLAGVSINEIEILSNRQQQLRDICVDSYNTLHNCAADGISRYIYSTP